MRDSGDQGRFGGEFWTPSLNNNKYKKMSSFINRLSIRTQMVIAALIMLIPMLLLARGQIESEVAERIEDVERIASTIATINSDAVAGRINMTRTLLDGLVQDPDVRSLDPAHCGKHFERFTELFPHYSNLATLDTHDKLICSSVPADGPGPVVLKHSPWQEDHDHGFYVGPMIQGTLSKRWVVPVYRVVRNDQNVVIGAVAASIDLLNLNSFVKEENFTELPDGTTAILFERDMTLLASHSPGADKLIGTKRLDAPALTELVRKRSGAVRLISSIDPVERIYAAVPVPGLPWTSVVSIPTAPLDASVEEVRWHWRYASMLAASISMVMALLMARRVGRPIEQIATVAQSVRDGDDSQPIHASGNREANALSTAFFEMLQTLHQQQAALLQRKNSLIEAQRIAKMGNWEYDLAAKRLEWSDEIFRIFEVDPREFVPTYEAFLEITHPEDRSTVDAAYQQSLKRAQPFALEHRLLFPDGHVKWVREQCETAFDNEGQPVRSIGTVMDITERKLLENELHKVANTDFLTGLASRRTFIHRVEEEIARMKRGINPIVGVLMIDLDFFKKINDAYGHAAGDMVLKHFASMLTDELRRTDMAGRIGGEEFGVLLPGADLEEAHAYAEKLRTRVCATPLAWNDGTIHWSISVGVTKISEFDTHADEILARVDKALYRAKGMGRNRVVNA